MVRPLPRRPAGPVLVLAAAVLGGCGGPAPASPEGCGGGPAPASPLAFVDLYDAALSGQDPDRLPLLLHAEGLMAGRAEAGTLSAAELAASTAEYRGRVGPVTWRTRGAVFREVGGRVVVAGRGIEERSSGPDPRTAEGRRVLVLDPGGPCGWRLVAEAWGGPQEPPGDAAGRDGRSP